MPTPNNHKTHDGDRIQDAALDMLETLIEATYPNHTSRPSFPRKRESRGSRGW